MKLKVGKQVQSVLDETSGDFEARSLVAIEQAREIMSRSLGKRADQEGELKQTLINNAPSLNSSYEGIMTAFDSQNTDDVDDELIFEGGHSDLYLISEGNVDDLIDLPFCKPLFSKPTDNQQEFEQRLSEINTTLNQSFEHIISK